MIVLVAIAAWAVDAPQDVMPDRHWDFQHLELEVVVHPETGSIDGIATHTVAPIGGLSPWLRLHQIGLAIASVEVDGTVTRTWRQGTGWLDIPMPLKGATHDVRVTYSATPQTGLHFRGGPGTSDSVGEVWSQGENDDNRHWFPSWDHPSDTFTVRQIYTVPEGWHAIGNGTLEDVQVTDQGSRHVYTLEQPIVNYLVVLAAGEYRVVQDDRARFALEYVVPRTVSEQTAQRTMGRTPDQVAYFEALLGHPYPYPLYRQVVVQRFLYGGMENASTTILADRTLVPDETTRWYGTESVVAHELAHQWFGDLLTCYGWRELWLNEGFATYYAWRWMEKLEGPEYAAGDLLGNMRAALHDPRPMAARSWSRHGSAQYASQYVRGMSVLRMVESLLGRDVFDAAIQTYVAENAFRLVESEDLRRVFEDAGGIHLGWLFDQYVYDNRIPILETGWEWEDGVLTVQVSPKPPEDDPAPRHTFVDIEVGLATDVMSRRVWVGEGAARLVLDTAEAPHWVAVNPTGSTLAHWTHEQPIEAWAAQLRHSPSPFAKWVAITHLDEDTAGVPHLIEVWRSPEIHPTLRAKAGRALGKVGSPEAVAAIGARAGDDAWDVRVATATALGEAPPSPQAERALRQLTRDPITPVRSAAIRSLAALDKDAGLATAIAELARRDISPTRQAHQTSLNVLGEHGEPRHLATLFPLLPSREHRSVRHGAARAAVSISERQDDPVHPRLSRAIEPFLDDPDQRARELGVWALARVGDEEAARRLVAFAAQNEIPGLSETARDAANRIRHHSSDEQPPRTPEDEERLDQRLKDLEDRIQDLETWR